MNKPMNLTLSIAITAIILIAGAALAAATQPPETTAKIGVESQVERSQAEPSAGLSTSSTALTVTLNGVRNANGNVMVMVFDQESAFADYDYERAVGYQEVKASREPLVVTFSSLTEGPYAVFAMHDENQDYRLNESAGYPSEGYATSGASSKYDEPSFTQAAVAKGDYELTLEYF